jgi:hypothetical protein
MAFHRNTWAVFGMLADKDVDGVIDALRERVTHWLPCALEGRRAASADFLAAVCGPRDRAVAGCFDSAARRSFTRRRTLAKMIEFSPSDPSSLLLRPCRRLAARAPRVTTMAEQDTSPDADLQLKKRARRRLVGAAALALFAVIVLPMVMDREPRPLTQDIQVRIPSQDSTGLRVPGPAGQAGGDTDAGTRTESRCWRKSRSAQAKPNPEPAPPNHPRGDCRTAPASVRLGKAGRKACGPGEEGIEPAENPAANESRR